MLIDQNDLVNNMDKDMVIGYKLDTWMDTMPLCMVILGLIGALTGFYMLYKQVK